MEKDTTIANVVTLSAVSLTVLNVIQILTVLSLATAISLNIILIYRNLKNKKTQ